MTKRPQRDNRKATLAQIHIAKKQLGMDDDTYRQTLASVTGRNGKPGKDSCSKMDIGELYQVINHLQKCGFKAKRPRKKQFSPKAQGQLIDVMRAVWIEMHQVGIVEDGSEQALTQWAKRQSTRLNGGVGVASLEWLERDQKMATQILESLKQWRGRIYRQWQGEDFAQAKLLIETGLNPSVAIKRLLDQHRIMYWAKFAEYGVEESPQYCRNRKELNSD